MKFEPGQQREIPDEEPLSAAELGRMDVQRARSQAALISRAASQGMTPMELFASGQVTAHEPDDRLAFDKSRQLPAAPQTGRLSEKRPSEQSIPEPSHTEQDCLLCGGPCHQTEIWRLVNKKLGDQMERTIQEVTEKLQEGRISQNDARRALGLSEPPPPVKRDYAVTEVLELRARRNGKSDLQRRMEEWLAKDQGRSFREGFDGYFKVSTPRAHEEEAVPQESINDDEVAEGELIDPEWREPGYPDTDIVDAEVIEDE